jgi:DNA-binding MarR family transcriptional regulator
MGYAKDKCHKVDSSQLRPWDRLVLQAIHLSTERPSRRRYFGAWIDFAIWLGCKPNVRESAAMSRALTRLEHAGLALRLPGRRVVLTRAGQRLADSLNVEPEASAFEPETNVIESPVVAPNEQGDVYVERYGDPEVPEESAPEPAEIIRPKQSRMRLSEVQQSKRGW